MASFLCFLLVFSAISISVAAESELIFHGFSEAETNFSLSGVAEIQKNGVLELTSASNKKMGRAFYSSPIRFKNSTNGSAFSFSTSFAFVIVPQYPNLGGHGLAFTISPSTDFQSALPRQYLGLFNATNVRNSNNHLFAVEFDTVQDVEFDDINDNHIGIDINSLESVAAETAAYIADDSTKQELDLKSRKKIMAWIDYDSVTKNINVTVSLSSSKPRFSIVSFHSDLSPIFHETMYVGFSASTGLMASAHYISGWSFKINGESKFLDLESLPSLPGGKKKQTGLIIGLSLFAIFFTMASISMAIYCVRRRRNADVIEPWELEVGPHRYSYQELKRATRGFKESELLGRGGFGRVYKGTLPDSKIQVAVKRISHESKQGLREFLSEIASIGRLSHRNLVQLLGWCRRRGDLLLVYDFMPNGSLDKYLFDEPKMVLNWERRFKVIKGVASVLEYLHEGYVKSVIHRDIKSSNVLLDGKMNGRLGDFGLARLHEHGSDPNTTRVVGTMGYLAPELPRSARATTRSDVFAFGALLLEVVCGRRPVEQKAEPEEMILVDCVWRKWKDGAILDVVDEKLRGEFDEGEVLLVLKLGLMCSNDDPLARPTMRQILRYLKGEMAPPEVLRPPNSSCSEKWRSSKGFESHFAHGDANDSSIVSVSNSPVSLNNRENGGR